MRDLVQKLPSGNPQHDHGTSDDTIAAVLATLNEVIKKHPEFSRFVCFDLAGHVHLPSRSRFILPDRCLRPAVLSVSEANRSLLLTELLCT